MTEIRTIMIYRYTAGFLTIYIILYTSFSDKPKHDFASWNQCCEFEDPAQTRADLCAGGCCIVRRQLFQLGHKKKITIGLLLACNFFSLNTLKESLTIQYWWEVANRDQHNIFILNHVKLKIIWCYHIHLTLHLTIFMVNWHYIRCLALTSASPFGDAPPSRAGVDQWNTQKSRHWGETWGLSVGIFGIYGDTVAIADDNEI